MLSIFLAATLSLGTIDCIDQTHWGQTSKQNRVRTLRGLDLLVLHRFGPEIDGQPVVNAKVAAEAFQKQGKRRAGWYTTGKSAYTYIYNAQRHEVYQALPWNRVGVHAKGYNYRSISVAVVDEYALMACGPDRNEFIEFLASVRAQMEDLGPRRVFVVGHTELPEASIDPHKTCFEGALIYRLRKSVYQKSMECLPPPLCRKESLDI
jgi:hypothetical protein